MNYLLLMAMLSCCSVLRSQNFWEINAKAYGGFNKLKWRAENLGKIHGERDRWSSAGVAVGVGNNWVFNDDVFAGLEYDYHRISFMNGAFNFADRCRVNELKCNFGYFTDNFLILDAPKVRRFHLGYSGMKTLSTNPFLIEFTSPYELRSKWAGWNFGMEFGRILEVGKGNNNVQFSWTYDFMKLQLIRAWTASNDKDIDSSGEMKITNFTFKVTFMFSGRIFERNKTE